MGHQHQLQRRTCSVDHLTVIPPTARPAIQLGQQPAFPGTASERLRLAGQLVGWDGKQLRLTVQIVAKLGGQNTVVVLHRRWTVERTFSWINRCRRTVRDYERLPSTTPR